MQELFKSLSIVEKTGVSNIKNQKISLRYPKNILKIGLEDVLKDYCQEKSDC